MGLSWGKIKEFCVILGIKLWDKIMIKGFVDITEERIQIFGGILLIQQEEYPAGRSLSLKKNSSLEYPWIMFLTLNMKKCWSHSEIYFHTENVSVLGNCTLWCYRTEKWWMSPGLLCKSEKCYPWLYPWGTCQSSGGAWKSDQELSTPLRSVLRYYLTWKFFNKASQVFL